MNTYKFDRDKDWPFESLSTRKTSYANTKRLKKNINIFGTWLLNLMESTAPRPRNEETETFWCQGVHLHPSNNEYLRQHIGGWDWLAYSPVDDESLALDEVGIVEWFTEKVR